MERLQRYMKISFTALIIASMAIQSFGAFTLQATMRGNETKEAVQHTLAPLQTDAQVHGIVQPQSQYFIAQIFPDPALAAVIASILGKSNTDSIVTDDELASITRLDASRQGITEIIGLEYLKNLETVILSNNNLTKLYPLAGLRNLQHLDVIDNNIYDLTPLRDLVNLKYLMLDRNNILRWDTLENLTQLVYFQSRNNQMQDISFLRNWTNLTTLDLGNLGNSQANRITQLLPLKNLTNLTKLDLVLNSIEDVTPLQNLTNLTDLSLGSNRIFNISALGNLQNLTRLNVAEQKYTKNILYVDYLFIPNFLRDNKGDQIIPSHMSDGGTFINPFLEWYVPPFTKDLTIGLDWRTNVRIGNASGTFSGTWKFSFSPTYVEFMLDGKRYDIMEAEVGKFLKEPAVAAREGYNFVGWFTDPEKGYKWEFSVDTMPFKKNLVLYGRFEPKPYVIVYNDEGRIKLADSKFGEKLIEPEAPTKPDAFFVGWFTEDDRQWDFEHDTMPASHLVLYAKYVTAYYTVSFDNEGEVTTQTVTIDTAIPEWQPTKDGYIFVGWFTDKTAGDKWDFAVDMMPNHDITLYARFEVEQTEYDVVFNIDGTEFSKETVHKGTRIPEPEKPTKVGHAFVGWYTGATDGSFWDFATDLMPAENITLYGRFMPQEYTTMFVNALGEAPANQSVVYGGKVMRPADPKVEGYRFLGWFTAVIEGEQWDFINGTMPARDLTLYARFEVDKTEYDVIFNADGAEYAKATVLAGTAISEPAPPTKEGYIFFGWYTETIAGKRWNFASDVMPRENLTLYARFMPRRYTAVFVNNRGDAPENQTVAYGGKLTRPTDPIAEGYRFLGWFTLPSEGVQWDFEHDTIGSNNVTLYARWEAIV